MPQLTAKIKEIYDDCLKSVDEGKVADYIPELAKIDYRKFGFYAISSKYDDLYIGDYNEKFSMQSVSKVLIFICAILDNTTKEVMEKVTVEPTYSSFNSIANLELENDNKPLNPFINSGAIVCTSFLKGESSSEKAKQVIDLIKKMTQNDDIFYNNSVYESESKTGSRNRALAYYMESTGILEGNVEETLDAYFKICAIEVTCKDLAKIAYVLAKDGYIEETGEQIFSPALANRVRTVMALCGMYDGSGDFAVNVGLPSKSGVGGGIMSISTKYDGIGIGIFGPSLDAKGNSVVGVKFLTRLSQELDLSIF